MSQAITGIGSAVAEMMKALQPSDVKKDDFEKVKNAGGVFLEKCTMVDKDVYTDACTKNNPLIAKEITLSFMRRRIPYSQVSGKESNWATLYMDAKVKAYLESPKDFKKGSLEIDDESVRRYMADKVGFGKFSDVASVKGSFKTLAEELKAPEKKE